MKEQQQPGLALPSAPEAQSSSISAFRATNLDLLLATVMALGLPFAASALFTLTGGHAIWGLLLYYGVCCIGIVWWRKGSLGYAKPQRWPWVILVVGLLVDLAITLINYRTFIDANASLAGFLLTIVIWVPLNSAMEQLSWVYVLDAWRTRWTGGALRWIGLAVGIVLMLILVSLIHIRFWLLFLPSSNGPFFFLVIPLNLLLTAAQVLAYYRSGSMWPAWIIHLFSDLQLILLAHYAIFPHL